MRLLLIEDDPKFGQSLVKVLENEGYALDWSQTGEDGLKRAIMEDYDLAIVDIGLPKMSGLEVVSTLRAQESNLPVLFLTALGQTKDKVTGLDQGGDDYLVKPVEIDELLARIRSLLRRPPQSESTVLTCGSLTLDPAKRAATRQGTTIRLSLKEYSLLDYLIRNQGRVCSRQDLLDHVWDGSLDPLSNTVDVYVGYLRSKIDRAFPDQPALLKTVQGVGYTLDNE